MASINDGLSNQQDGESIPVDDGAESNSKPRKAKRRSRRKKILLILAIILVVLVSTISVLLYGPVKTMASLRKVDDFPLYVMHYRGTYLFDLFIEVGMDCGIIQKIYKSLNPDACSSFAALNPEGDAIFGRNFDWKHRSSMLLFTDPPNGYASVSMVDLYYLGLEGMQEIPWSKRFVLLGAPYATIDGMNECGVAIGQNAVPHRQMPKDPNKITLLQSQILRLVLDHAKDVNEAIDLIKNYNVQFILPNHLHIADVSGNSAVVEYVDGDIVIVRQDKPWQVSTNFLISETQPIGAESNCNRYNEAYRTLSRMQGKVTDDEAMRILKAVTSDSTVWSVVYNLSTGRIQLVMGRDYDNVHSFKLKMKHQPGSAVKAGTLPIHTHVVWPLDLQRQQNNGNSRIPALLLNMSGSAHNRNNSLKLRKAG